MTSKIFKETLKIKRYIFLDKNPDRIEVISKKNIILSIIESLSYTILILLVCYALPFTRNNFLSLNIHPLAVMVAIISLRYGIYAGFSSAFIATLGYLTAYIFSGNDMVLFFLKFQYYKFFIMFLFIAMILGKFQANRKENEEIAKRDAEKLEKLLEEEKQKKEELLKINRDLKNQIITSRGGVISFQNIRRSLNLLTTVEQVLTKSINIINQFMNCENASIYIVKNQNLNQIIKIGNSSLGKILNLSEVQADRFLMTLEKGETLEFPLDLKGEKPVFIAPIFYGKKIIALLEITKLSYETSKNENFELFKIIMEEINNLLSRIFSENEKNNIHIFEKDTFITTKKYFEQILDEVKDRKKYYNQRYFILEGNNKNKYSSEELQKRLDEMEKNNLNTDYVTMFDDKIKFLIINGDNVNNRKQSEIVKNILKEETLYEI